MRPGHLVLVAWSLLVASACKNDLDRVAAIDVPSNGPDRVTTGAEYLFSDSGIVRNQLRAGTIADHSSTDHPYTDLSDGVEITFFDVAGRENSHLTSRRGRIWNKERRMQVDEQVVFTNAKGERLETEQLIWEQDSGRVHTDRPVKIVRARDILYGQGLDADEGFDRYTIRQITGTLFIDRSDTLAPARTAR